MKLKVSIDGNLPNLFGVFREEEGKVWGRCFNYDPNELLYYDFAANVEDVLSFGINTFGQLVITKKGTNEIPMSGMPEGVYLIRITDIKGRNHGIKVVKN